MIRWIKSDKKILTKEEYSRITSSINRLFGLQQDIGVLPSTEKCIEERLSKLEDQITTIERMVRKHLEINK